MKKYTKPDGGKGVGGEYQMAKVDPGLLKGMYNAHLKNEAQANGQQKAKPGRLGALARAGLNAVGQKIVQDVIPYSSGSGILNELWNIYKTAGYKVFRARKHDYGQDALENNIPIVKEAFQNFWSLGNFGRGLAKIKSLYTVKALGGTEEKPIFLELTDDQVSASLTDLRNLGKAALTDEGDAISLESKLRDKLQKYGENEETTLSGVYSEITDKETKRIVDPTNFRKDLLPGDLWLTGMKGQRNVIYSSTLEGIEITKYDTASFMDHWGYRTEQNLKFTLTGLLYKFINIEDFSPIAKQSIIEDQLEHVIKATHRRRGRIRADGIPNPIIGME
ncbi:MAG: hypothetical protein V3U72_03845 [Candidatus Aenigmarchaeota archaeon]